MGCRTQEQAAQAIDITFMPWFLYELGAEGLQNVQDDIQAAQINPKVGLGKHRKTPAYKGWPLTCGVSV